CRVAAQPRAEADVDQLDASTVDSTGTDHQARLERAERDRQVGPHRGAGYVAGVHVDAGRHVDGDDGPPVRGGRDQLGRVVAEAAAPADAEDAVDHEVHSGRRLLDDSAAVSAQGG